MFAVLLVAACAGPRPTAPTAPTASVAEQAFQRGDYQQAAEAWQREARGAGTEEAAHLLLRAAEAWALAGEEERAQAGLSRIERAELSPADEARLDLLMADLSLRQGRLANAESLLEGVRARLPTSLRARYEELRARELELLSGAPARGMAAVAREVDAMTQYDPATALALMKSLEPVSSTELAVRARNPETAGQLSGWLDLALVIRNNLVDGSKVQQAIAEWKRRRPQHLLSEGQALDTWLHYRQVFTPPRFVAVLLPGSGRLEAAAAAIRDGLLSAYLENPGGAEVQFFTTGEDNQSVISAYYNALDAGADWIVGPLRKEAVEAVFNLQGMTTPLLALNELPAANADPASLTGQVWGIALSQESEAAAAARRAAREGYRNAMVLAPEGEWGDRMAQFFEGEFRQQDRQIVADVRYADAENDHSAVLEHALKIDESEARMRRLENTLQMELEFEPVRRHDVDAIFLAASANQAKLIRTQLKFLDAGDIPLLTTGRAYSGRPDPVRNQDLNGLVFAAAPWQVRHARAEQLPDLSSLRGGSLGLLYALGRDAWNMLPWLGLMNEDPEFRFPGASGYYSEHGQATLRRDPQWAEFQDGLPVALPDASLSGDP